MFDDEDLQYQKELDYYGTAMQEFPAAVIDLINVEKLHNSRNNYPNMQGDFDNDADLGMQGDFDSNDFPLRFKR